MNERNNDGSNFKLHFEIGRSTGLAKMSLDIIRKDSDFCELCCNKITAIDQVNSVVFPVSSNIFLVLWTHKFNANIEYQKRAFKGYLYL